MRACERHLAQVRAGQRNEGQVAADDLHLVVRAALERAAHEFALGERGVEEAAPGEQAVQKCGTGVRADVEAHLPKHAVAQDQTGRGGRLGEVDVDELDPLVRDAGQVLAVEVVTGNLRGDRGHTGTLPVESKVGVVHKRVRCSYM
jgi:hypothetical protein